MIYRFDDFSIDIDSLELRKGDNAISVEPQVFSVLAFLVENRDRVVSKDDLIEAIWGGRAVSDSAVNSRINAARRAVGDSGDAQAVIKTYPRRGFKFVADLVENELKTPLPQMATSLSRKPSIAILPFTNLSGDMEQEYFSDGITEDIITALSRIRQFFVIASSTTSFHKNYAGDVSALAKQLGARYVLRGSVRSADSQIRVTAQLIDGPSGNTLWATKFDRKLEDIFVVQDQITDLVLGELEP